MWCRNVAAGLASLRRPARARAATSIPPRSPMASKRPRKGPETKTMQNSPCRDHATTLRRPCNTLQSPLQKPCSTPGGEEAPRRRGLPVTPRNPQEEEAPSPSRRPKRRPPADGSPARSVQIASGGHRSGALAVGAAVLADAAVSALLQNSLHVWDRDTSVFPSESPHVQKP